MKKRVLFCGTPHIAVPALEALSHIETVEIIGVVTPPDKPIGRKQIRTPCPVKQAATAKNLPIFEVQRKADLPPIFRELKPDLVLVIAFGILFPGDILDLPNLGTLNVHFSLLPKWRGASPVQASILAGEKESGITFQKMVPALDAGDILWQKSFSTAGKRTSAVWEFFATETARALPDFLKKLFAGEIIPRSQKEDAVTLCGKIEKADGEVFLMQETAEEIERKFRAFDVWPGIFTETQIGRVKLLDVSLKQSVEALPLQCKSGTLYVKTLQPEGRTPMAGKAFQRGYPDVFSER